MAFRNNYKNTDTSSLFSTTLTKSTCPLRSWFPVFKHPTVFKPFGVPAEDGTIQPWRLSDEDNDFSDWLYPLQIVCKAGTERKLTFLAPISDADSYGEETPYSRLLTVVRQLARSKNPEFEGLLKAVNQQSPCVPKIEAALAIQGMILLHGGKSYMASPLIDLFMVLVKTSHDALLEKLNKPSNNRMAKNIEDRWESGNVVDPANGKTIHVFAAGANAGNTQVNWGAVGANQEKSKGTDFSRYDVDIVNGDAPPHSLADLVKSHFRPWDSVFHKLSSGEMMEQLCGAYKSDLIMRAFTDSVFEDLVPSRIRTKFSAPGKYVPGFNDPKPPASVQATSHIPATQYGQVTQPAVAIPAGEPEPDLSSTESQIEKLKRMAEKLKKQ